MNPNWARWINLSIANHFNKYKGEYVLQIEGQDIPDMTPKEACELRTNGPFVKQLDQRTYNLDIDINTLLKITFDETDGTRVSKAIGYFLDVFTKTIEIRKYGDGPEDDGTLIDCLLLKSDKGDDIIVNNFGMISPDIRMIQVTIDAIYGIILTEDD